ncbi:hypothetical protein ACNR9W_013545 [Paracoccus sp. T5]
MMGVAKSGRTGPELRMLKTVSTPDHLLHRVDRMLDLDELRAALAEHYSARGRPSVGPELLIHMVLVSRIYGIRS